MRIAGFFNLELIATMMCVAIFAFPAMAATSLGVQTNLATVSSHDITAVPKEAHSIVDVFTHVQLVNDSDYYLAAGFLYQNSITPLTATTEQILTLNGPYIGLTVFGYRDAVSMTLGFLPYVLADYTRTATEKWLGSGVYGKFGFHPKISDDWGVDLELTYNSSTYSQKFSEGSFTTITGFGHSAFSPLIGLRLKF